MSLPSGCTKSRHYGAHLAQEDKGKSPTHSQGRSQAEVQEVWSWTQDLGITWKLVEMQIVGPTPDLLNYKHRGRGPAICALINLQGILMQSGFKTTNREQRFSAVSSSWLWVQNSFGGGYLQRRLCPLPTGRQGHTPPVCQFFTTSASMSTHIGVSCEMQVNFWKKS